MKKSMVWIFGIGILIRGIIAFLHLKFFEMGTFQNPMYIIEQAELYLDYKYYYWLYADEFIHHGWLPYVSDISSSYGQIPYLYPPFFLYFLTIFALIHESLTFMPLFLADLLLPIVVYKILLKWKNEQVAIWGFSIQILNPLSILYGGGLFLNITLVAFFIGVLILFVIKQQYTRAIICLAVATLLKQITIFFLSPLLLYIAVQTAKIGEEKPKFYTLLKQMLKFGLLFLLICFLGSLPWIFVSYPGYIASITLGQRPVFFPEFLTPGSTWPRVWYDFLVEWGAPYWLIFLCGFLNFTLLGIVAIEVFSIGLIYTKFHKNQLSMSYFFKILVISSIFIHLLLPRGVYKYYFLLHVPLIILWFSDQFAEKLDHSQRFRIYSGILFIIISLVIIFLDRSYYLLILWGIAFTICYFRNNPIEFDNKIMK